MPPPKKPKTGTAWVEDFLSANETAELKDKKFNGERMGNHSKFTGGQSNEEGTLRQHNETFRYEHQTNGKEGSGSTKLSELISDHGKCTDIISDNLVSSSRCQKSDFCHENKIRESPSHSSVSDDEDSELSPVNEADEELVRNYPPVSPMAQNLSKVHCSPLLEKCLSSGSYLTQCSGKRRENYTAKNYKMDEDLLLDYQKVQGNFSQVSQNSETADTNSGGVTHFGNVHMFHKKLLEKRKSYPGQDLRSQNQISEIKPGAKLSANPSESRVRKVESLMMRRQLDSLMEVCEPAESLVSHSQPTQCLEAMVQKVHTRKFPLHHDSANYYNSASTGRNVLSPPSTGREHTSNEKAAKEKCPIGEELDRENIRICHKYFSNPIDRNSFHDIKYPKEEKLPDNTKTDKNKGPITKLEHMCYSNAKSLQKHDSSYSPFKNSFSSADLVPYMYQRNPLMPISIEEKNKAPHLASSGDLILDRGVSSSNINTIRTRRPAWLPQSGHLNADQHKEMCSVKRPAISLQQQNVNSSTPTQVNNRASELTSSEQNKKLQSDHKRILQQVLAKDEQLPPPLFPIGNIMHTRDMSHLLVRREPMDQEYEEQAMATSTEHMNNASLMTTHSSLTPLSTNSSYTAAPYLIPHPNYSMSQGLRDYGRSDTFPSDAVASSSSSSNLLNLTGRASQGIFKTTSCPTMPSACQEPKYAGAIPNPIKSPTFLSQLAMANSMKVDSSVHNDHIITSAASSTVNRGMGLHAISMSTSSLDQPHHQSPSSPERQPEIPSSTIDLKKKTVEDRAHGRRCQICNDTASGFHYGVWSCEGCKAFFKRSLQGPVDYVCPSTNTCTIDKQRRKSCQACRLRKCVEMGMSRGNSRKERKPSLSKGPKRKPDTIDTTENMGPSDSKLRRPDGLTPSLHPQPWDSGLDSSMMSGGGHSPLSSSTVPSSHYHTSPHPGATASSSSSPPLLHHQYSPSSQLDHSSTSSNSSVSPNPHQQQQYSPGGMEHQPLNPSVANGLAVAGTSSSSLSLSSVSGARATTTTTAAGSVSQAVPGAVNTTPLIQEASSISTSQLPIDPLVEHLLRIDPPIRASGHDSHKPNSEKHLMTSLMRLADSELVDVINWAKSIPGYAELAFQDRVHLLEVCWMEILILGILWHTLKSPDNTPVGETFIMATDLVLDRLKFEEVSMWHIGCQLKAYLQEMSSLCVNQEEFVLLRALVLVNSDRSSGESRGKISSLRSRILHALHYTTIERYHGSVSKVMNLLTLLPHIRQLGQQWISHFVRSSDPHQLASYGLLKEMIEAYLKCVDCTFCETMTLKGHHKSQESRSSSLEPNGTISVSPSLSPASDLNV